MADLLLELFSEEIPARMQAQAAKDLERLVIGALSDRGLLFEAAKAFSGPRRLTLAVNGLPAKQPDVSEEKKGPRINAPEKAIEGFLRSAGVTLDQCEKRDDGKGEFYVAVISRKGRDTAEVLAEVLPETFAKLPWPKSMRFPGSPVRWVRPLHSIVCTLDGEVVPFEFAGVKSGDVTYGHRFLSQDPIEVRRFEDYEKKLHDAYVLIDPARRKEIIWEDAKAQAFVHNLEPIADEGLLDEVSGLAEWPVVLTGKIEDQFMDVPAEILQTSMRTHQKYFSTKDSTGKLANRFIVVANMVAQDGGKEIIAGNERVLRARLSDAKFFWDQDRKRSLESRVDDLKGIIFHAKLGTQYERVQRIQGIAEYIAGKIGADVPKVVLAAQLCKADLTTGVVGEFPELQGVMGCYYALHDKQDVGVAEAIRDHYKPLGPRDIVPTDKLTISVALADKLDQLIGFFAIDERPTGSGDPFALRRAAIGALNILLKSNQRIDLIPIIFAQLYVRKEVSRTTDRDNIQKEISQLVSKLTETRIVNQVEQLVSSNIDQVSLGKRMMAYLPYGVALRDFILDRLEVVLRDGGVSADICRAARTFWTEGSSDDEGGGSHSYWATEGEPVVIVLRVDALQSFLKSDDGANLLVAYKRAANILKAEEKKDKVEYFGDPDPEDFVLPEEKALFEDLATASESIRAEVESENFAGAMGVMARLRAPVDAFFDKVTVNDKDPGLRKNRLLLLSRLRATLHLVADFSKIEG